MCVIGIRGCYFVSISLSVYYAKISRLDNLVVAYNQQLM